MTVVDAKHFLGRLESQGNEAEEQVAFADVILLNKTDLVSADDLAKVEGARSARSTAMPRSTRRRRAASSSRSSLDKGRST